MQDKQDKLLTRIIVFEWISTIAIVLGCFLFLSQKIEKQSDRTDKLYEMFIELLKEGRK